MGRKSRTGPIPARKESPARGSRRTGTESTAERQRPRGCSPGARHEPRGVGGGLRSLPPPLLPYLISCVTGIMPPDRRGRRRRALSAPAPNRSVTRHDSDRALPSRPAGRASGVDSGYLRTAAVTIQCLNSWGSCRRGIWKQRPGVRSKRFSTPPFLLSLPSQLLSGRSPGLRSHSGGGGGRLRFWRSPFPIGG